MPTVTGNIRRPADGSQATGGVTFQLVGEAGRTLPAAFSQSLNATIEGSSSVDLSSGAYSIAVPSNDELLPAGTRWRRTHGKSGSVLLYVEQTPSTQREEDILADPPGTLASAALTAHAADTTLHGGGLELAYAGKSDADFTTTSTTGADVPGLSITLTVPSRPYAVELFASCTIEEANQWGALLLVDSSNNPVGAPQPTFGKASAGFLGASNYQAVTRIPNAMHAPAAGTTVTYKARAQTSVATSDFTVKTQLFGPSSVAHIRAWTL